MDQTAMLIAALGATWGVILALARELRAMWTSIRSEDRAEIAELKTMIADLNSESRKAVQAKDSELAELRKLLLTQYKAATRGEGQ